MFPLSFRPMIWKTVLPEILELLVPLNKYKDEPNDADKEIEKHKEQINMLAGEIGALEDRLQKIEILNKKTKNG